MEKAKKRERHNSSNNPLKWTLVEWLQVIGWVVFINIYWLLMYGVYVWRDAS